MFLSGLLFLALTLLRLREMILDAVPASLRAAIAAGIGLFIAFIGLTHAGIVTKSPAPGAYVQIGDLASPVPLVALSGLAVTAVLFARGVRGGILIGLLLIMLTFDTVGTLIGVSEQAGLMEGGRLPRADRAMLADAVGTLAGAALGTSTVSSYIESARGVAEGARTGLANVMTATLFLGALFFAPVVAMVGGGVRVGDLYYYPIFLSLP